MKRLKTRNDDAFSWIIDQPSHTMKHELIDFDIDANIQLLMDVSKIKPSTRMKPVIGILRGTGGGKTRMIEELKKEMVKKENILTLAITFNNHSEYGADDDWRIPCYILSYQLSLIARFGSVFFEKRHSEIANTLKKKN
jgi:hypothetical protein